MAYLQANTPQSKDYFHAHRMIHGTGIFTYIYHKTQLNVGKYTIHGSCGIQWAIRWNSCVTTFISCFVFFVKSSISSSFRWSSCKMCLYPLEPGPSSCTMHHNFICPSVTKNIGCSTGLHTDVQLPEWLPTLKKTQPKHDNIPRRVAQEMQLLFAVCYGYIILKLKTCWLNIVELHLAIDLWNKHHLISTKLLTYEDMPLSVVLFHFQSKFRNFEEIWRNETK